MALHYIAIEGPIGVGKTTVVDRLAERLEAESSEWDRRSDDELHLHHRWAQATTGLQISIALAAITLLTRRRWLVWGVYGVAGVGVALGVAAALHV